MSLSERYKLDLGFGGTSFGYDVTCEINGERHSCFGSGRVDSILLPYSRNEIVVTRVGYDREIMSARYTYGGDLIEVNIFLGEFYDSLKIKKLPIDTGVKKDLNSLTNDGTDPANIYINLQTRMIGFISGDVEGSSNTYFSENNYETENLDGGWAIPLYDDDVDDGLDDDFDSADSDVSAEENLIQFYIDNDYVKAFFKLNSDDTFVQPFARKINTKVFKGTPKPKEIKDILKIAFPEGE